VADELILAATTPEQQQQQQLPGEQRLSISDAVRVLWSLCVYGALTIDRYGWLLVAVAGAKWQTLCQEQLLVIKQGQVSHTCDV